MQFHLQAVVFYLFDKLNAAIQDLKFSCQLLVCQVQSVEQAKIVEALEPSLRGPAQVLIFEQVLERVQKSLLLLQQVLLQLVSIRFEKFLRQFFLRCIFLVQVEQFSDQGFLCPAAAFFAAASAFFAALLSKLEPVEISIFSESFSRAVNSFIMP